MAQDATEAVTEAAKSATDVAEMFTPDKLMGYWQTAQPVVINSRFKGHSAMSPLALC